MFRPRTQTTSLLLFSVYSNSSRQHGIAGLFLHLTEKWIQNQDKSILSSIITVNALEQVTAFCHPGTTAATLFGESRVSWACGRLSGVTSMDREPSQPCNCYRTKEKMPLSSSPGLLSKISSSATPHWGGHQCPSSPVAEGGRGHVHTGLLFCTAGYTVIKARVGRMHNTPNLAHQQAQRGQRKEACSSD